MSNFSFTVTLFWSFLHNLCFGFIPLLSPLGIAMILKFCSSKAWSTPAQSAPRPISLSRFGSLQSLLRDFNLLPFSAFLLILAMIFSLWPQLGACLFCILVNRVMAMCFCKTLSTDLAQQSERKWSSSHIEGQKIGRLRKWSAILLCTDQTYLRTSSKSLRPNVLDLAITTFQSLFLPAYRIGV